MPTQQHRAHSSSMFSRSGKQTKKQFANLLQSSNDRRVARGLRSSSTAGLIQTLDRGFGGDATWMKKSVVSTAFLSVAPRVDGGRFRDGSTKDPQALYGAALVTRGRRGAAAAGARGGGMRE
jgi:hypothetical protein